MKTSNYLLDTKPLSETIDISYFSTQENVLIQIFCGQEKDILQNLLDEVAILLPMAICLGTTTDGEIEGKNIYTQRTILSISTFTDTEIKSASAQTGDSFKNGEKLARELIQEDTKLLIVFTDGTSSNGEDFLKGIESVNDRVIVAGGMAGDNANFVQTYIAEGSHIFDTGAVGVSLNSDILQVYNGYSFNWEPIGVEHSIDMVEENRVYRIDGIPTVEFYAKYLGQAVADALPSTGIEFPLILERSGVQVARAVLSKHDDGSLSFAGNLHKGDKVKLGFGNAELIINNPYAALENFCNQPVESFFIYSCMARRRYMPDFIQVEIEPFSQLADVSGFFTYAEFYHHDRHNELFNQTLTAVALSESLHHDKRQQCKDRQDIPQEYSEYATTIQALTHLIQQSTADLEAQADTLNREKKFSQKLLSNQKIFMRQAIHETMTPLSVIMNNIELSILKKGKTRYLSNMEAAMKNLFTIYDDLSYLVKKNQIAYPKSSIDFLAYLQSRVDFFKEVAAHTKLSFVVTSNIEDIKIYFNETKLQRIIDNNITNAIKYTQEDEVIYISIELQKSSCILSFSSHSTHIQYPNKVFDAYYREDNKEEGFGLGLNLVKQICDKEGVEITLTSDEHCTQFDYRFKVGS